MCNRRVVAGLLGAGLINASAAAALLTASAQSSACVVGLLAPGCHFNNAFQQSQSAASASAPSASFGGGLQTAATGSGQSTYGHFLAKLNISLSESNYRADSQTGYAGATGAQVNLGFQDQLTVAGPIGGPVQVKYTAILDYSYSAHGNPSEIFLHQITDHASLDGAPLPSVGTAMLTLTGGTTYALAAGESAVLETDCGFCLPVPDDPLFPDMAELAAELDATHSLHIYFDVLTAGFGLTSVSGHDYSIVQSVPEPGALPLLVTLSLFGFFTAAWRPVGLPRGHRSRG